jgi:hypothetical protein
MKLRVLVVTAAAICGMASCASAPPGASPPVGCYDSTDMWDVRITDPLGTVGNVQMLYGSTDGTCGGAVSSISVGTLAQGGDGQVACNAAVGAGNWIEQVGLSTFTIPRSLAGYWMCLPPGR